MYRSSDTPKDLVMLSIICLSNFKANKNFKPKRKQMTKYPYIPRKTKDKSVSNDLKEASRPAKP